MIELNKTYERETFLNFLKNDFIPEFTQDIRDVKNSSTNVFDDVQYLGQCSKLDLQVFEFTYSGSSNKRVTLTKDAFSIMKGVASFRALAIFKAKDSSDWRVSLMTAHPIRGESGKVILSYSNPRRFSFLLGPNAKVNTPTKFLIKRGSVENFSDLQNRFSLEVVNKEFYSEISQLFTRLVGGSIYKGKRKESYTPSLKLPSSKDNIATSVEFAVRLIGRIIFCWFLREKKSAAGKPLMPLELLSLATLNETSNYYNSVLEPVFFETLNKPYEYRKELTNKGHFMSIPYLNGGLFSPHDDDFYKNNGLVVPDTWLREFFEMLETYNFTLDENTAFDEELSVDPEMLGRIFENLLAEINPETGESARKSTGSYYTPRVIVDCMVDESLFLYLSTKTLIAENKLRALISYDLHDDTVAPLDEVEKLNIIDALESIRILDPACGSGAFPMGALQKIVFILQQIDTEGQLWFKKQLLKTSPEIRRILEQEFNNKNFDYVRKLGIIRENIYGVDIQPIATEISRLRCFLTLVVDQQIIDSSPNRGIYPLPNLDFKFVCANTLVSPPDANWGTLGFDDDFHRDFSASVSSYFGAFDPIEKQAALNKLHELIDRKSDENIKYVLNDSTLYKEEKLRQAYKIKQKELHSSLLNTAELWKSYKNIFRNKKVDFFDVKYFFPTITDGFDIVIANPPYIKEYTDRSAFDNLRKSPYYQGKMDIWYLFACKCLDVLKNDTGVFSFIAQNNWVTSHGASILRNKVIKETQIIKLIDFGEYKIFESAGIQTMIMIFQKSKKYLEYIFDYRRLKGQNIKFSDVTSLLTGNTTTSTEYLTPKVRRDALHNKLLTFNNTENDRILNKIQASANFKLDPQKEIAQGMVYPQDKINKSSKLKLGNSYRVGEGIFVLTDSEKNDISLTGEELKLVKPVYTSKELFRWNADHLNSEWVIYTDSRFKDTKHIDNYPNIKKHLDKFTKVITSDNKPYGLHRARDEKFFIGEKIISTRKCTNPTFTYVNFDSYVSATYYVIKSTRLNLKYLVGLLNSKLIKYWLRNKGKMQGNNYQIDKEPLADLPLMQPSMSSQEKIVAVVDNILSAVKETNYVKDAELLKLINDLENQINMEVYKIYGLTQDEINVIEKTL